MSNRGNQPNRGADRGRGTQRGRGSPAGGRGSPAGGRGSPAGARISPTASATGSDVGFSGRGRGRGGAPSYGQGQGQGQGPRGGSPGPSGRGGGGSRGGFGAPAQVFAAGRPAVIDERLSTSDQLITTFRRMGVRDEMPFRPGWGTLGRPVTLRANFFAVTVTKGVLYDYEVSISPKDKARTDRKERIFQLLENHAQFAPHVGYTAHDRNQRLVSAKKLPQLISIPIRLVEEGETAPRDNVLEFTVDIKFVRELNTNQLTRYMEGQPEHRDHDPLPLVSALNLVLQQHANKTGTRAGRNRYFFPSSERRPLALGLEAWKGFFMSVRPAYKQLMVNINVCMTAFYVPGNLADAMRAFERQAGGMPTEFSQKLKISTSHLGYTRKRTILRIMSTNAQETTFSCAELGGTVTVEQYFSRKYRIRLKYASNLPVVDVGGSNYLPAEICDILPNQAYRGRLDGDATAAMIKYASNPPAVNAEAIVNQGFRDLGLLPGASTGPLDSFGLSVKQDMAVVPGRILPPPTPAYKAGRANVNNGSWNILNVKFQSGGNMANWAVLLVQDSRRGEFAGGQDPGLARFLQTFAQKCRSSGMVVPDGPPTIMATPRLEPYDRKSDPSRSAAIAQIRKTIEDNLDLQRKPSFVLVLLSDVDKHIHPGIKRLGDVELGLHTVCMLLKKAKEPKRQDQYFSNVALKVNTKLGGINHLLDTQSMKWLREEKTMLVGIDVTHTGPGSVEGTPSIAAVVASVDDDFTHFPASLALQKPDWNKDAKEAKEMVEDLTRMMVERLLLYQQRNECLPERVHVFRDGVSEGQYDVLLREELPRILDAFKEFSPNTPYRPKLTIVVCGKRHHARFLPTEPKNMAKNGNTLPGTVVDKGVTDIYRFDFYLQAHAGLQGTVRPTHYVVVYDESRYDADTLQQGTHKASFLYARATKAVSLVPAAYYADIACERGRCYINSLLNAPEGGASGGGRAGREERDRVFQRAVEMWGEGVHPDLRESMFYI